MVELSWLITTLVCFLKDHVTCVDLTPSVPEDITLDTFVVQGYCQRMIMGLSPCPYFTIKDILVVENIISGNRNCRSNIFRWVKFVLDLPGGKPCDPTRP